MYMGWGPVQWDHVAVAEGWGFRLGVLCCSCAYPQTVSHPAGLSISIGPRRSCSRMADRLLWLREGLVLLVCLCSDRTPSWTSFVRPRRCASGPPRRCRSKGLAASVDTSPVRSGQCDARTFKSHIVPQCVLALVSSLAQSLVASLPRLALTSPPPFADVTPWWYPLGTPSCLPALPPLAPPWTTEC